MTPQKVVEYDEDAPKFDKTPTPIGKIERHQPSSSLACVFFCFIKKFQQLSSNITNSFHIGPLQAMGIELLLQAAAATAQGMNSSN